jgi:hypothetical protein
MSYLFQPPFIIQFNCIYLPQFLALVSDYSQRNLTPKTKILAAYCESTVIELPGPYSTLAQLRPMGCILGLVVSILPLTQRQSSLSRQITTPDSLQALVEALPSLFHLACMEEAPPRIMV